MPVRGSARFQGQAKSCENADVPAIKLRAGDLHILQTSVGHIPSEYPCLFDLKAKVWKVPGREHTRKSG